MCVMQHTETPHMTAAKAAETLGVSPREVEAMTQDGTLDSIVEFGTLRVSDLSVHRLWYERGQAELRAMGVL